MNGDILKKAIDELQGKEPRIDYVLGMLETLYELEGTKPLVISGSPMKKKRVKVEEEDPDEEEEEETEESDEDEDEEEEESPAPTKKKGIIIKPGTASDKPLSPDEKQARDVPSMRLPASKEEVKKVIAKYRKKHPEVTQNGVAMALKLSPITVQKLWE